MDKLDFLNAPEGASDDAHLEDVAPAPEPQPEPQAATPAPEPAPEPAPAPAPVAEAKPDVPQGHVPLSAMLDEREKRKELERQLQEFQRQQTAPKVPDPDEDPDAYNRFQIDQAQQIALNTRLDMSEEMAREKHGNDVVDAARDWTLQRFQQNPAYRDEVLSQRNPWGYAVQQFQRHTALDKLGDTSEIDAFLAWKAAQATGVTTTQPAAPAADPSPAPTIPTRSLASAPSAGGPSAPAEAAGPGAAYGSIFGQ
jgi:hypothetical protein